MPLLAPVTTATRPIAAFSDVEQRLQLVLGADEVARGERLEADGGPGSRPQAQLDVERDPGGREREQALPLRLLQLAPSEKDVPKAHLVSASRGSAEADPRRAKTPEGGRFAAAGATVVHRPHRRAKDP
jgi:hypothetical protein